MEENQLKNLLVYQQQGGFVCQIEENDALISSASYKGAFPRIDIWLKAPELWIWLIDKGLFDVKKTTINKPEKLMLSIDFESIENSNFRTADVVERESEFIMILIDVLEAAQEDIPDSNLANNDNMRLDVLEKLCHSRNTNLYDLFLALEEERDPVMDSEEFEKWKTNACLYYQAISILLNVENMSIKELSRRTGLLSENLMSDRSEALRGKKKTMTIRSLYLITKALNISISSFLVLCRMIQTSNLYEIFTENKGIPVLR